MTADAIAGDTPEATEQPLELRVLTDADEVDEVVPEWRDLAVASGLSPFVSPDWLVPWWQAYGGTATPLVVTLWREDRLVALAPVFRTEGRAGGVHLRELGLWGRTTTPISGGVDLIVGRKDERVALDAFTRWLAADAGPWDVAHVVRCPTGSALPDALALGATAGGWRVVELTGELQSEAMAIDLPESAEAWQGYLGSKARRNIRREQRLFAEELDGRIELHRDPTRAVAAVDDLRRLMAARWGSQEKYFDADPRFEGFIRDALARMTGHGAAFVVEASDRSGVVGVLVVAHVGRRAAAILIGLSTDERYHALSLGKSLFHRAIDESVQVGCRSFDFLWAGDYKAEFWHATPRLQRSAILTRGTRGALVAARVGARRTGKAARDALARR